MIKTSSVHTFRKIGGGFVAGVFSLFGLGVTATIDLSDAPGGDLSLDDIFGEESSTSTTVVNNPNEPATATPTTTPSGPFLKTKTGTVYKSVEDAVEGIEHKDTLIAQLREQVKQRSGVDPLAAQRSTSTPSTSYNDNKQQYFADIAKAVDNKDTEAYYAAQQKLVLDSLGFLSPTITSLSKANAERVVSEQIPEFKGFLASEQYARISEESPLLADAIRSAEANPAAANQLPELYRIAYLANQGRRVPELIQSVRTENPPVQQRPTVQSTPLAPPATTGVPTVQPSLDTAAGRKALIEQMEGKGIGNQKW